MIALLLEKRWPYLSEENLQKAVESLVESSLYATNFNTNYQLRDQLRMCGLMQSRSSSGSSRLPHLLEQAVGGFTILFTILFDLFRGGQGKEIQDNGGLSWNRAEFAEGHLVR